MSPCALEPNSLDLVLGKPLFRSVIELCRPRTLVCRHFLSVLERSAVGEVGGDTGSPDSKFPRRCPPPRRACGSSATHPAGPSVSRTAPVVKVIVEIGCCEKVLGRRVGAHFPTGFAPAGTCARAPRRARRRPGPGSLSWIPLHASPTRA